MKQRRGPRRGRVIPALFFSFAAGVVTGWMIHRSAGPDPVLEEPAEATALPREGEAFDPGLPAPGPAPAIGTGGREERPVSAPPRRAVDAVADLRSRALLLPIEGARIEGMRGQFGENRDRTRSHEAVDILSPKGTPIRAVEDGTIARLFQSKAGGTTIYQFEPTGRFCYYYAHLARYAPHLREGLAVKAGEVIGYVGTSGNAPPGTPHLHFAIFELTSERQWWNGRAIDPYVVFSVAP